MAIILLAVAGYFLYKPAERTGEKITRLESGDELATTEPGMIISDFPMEFILEPGAAIEESYSLRYLNDGVAQPVVEYMSGLTLAENIDLFDIFFARGSWEITHRATIEEAPITYYYAMRDNEQVNVSFLETPELKVQVTIAYAVKSS